MIPRMKMSIKICSGPKMRIDLKESPNKWVQLTTKCYLSKIPNQDFLIYLLSSKRSLFGPLDIGSSCTTL